MRKAWPNSSSSRSAFTLIEILVVIAIIALLAALLFPAFARAKESGRQTTCATNLQQISIAVQQYFQDERRYPDSLVDLLPEGAKFDDGSVSNTAIIAVNVTGYLKNGSDGLLCPDDDLDNTTPRSSYGSLNKVVTAFPAPPSGAPTGGMAPLTGAGADPNADIGKYAYNYWGYNPDGLAFPDAATAATADLPASVLVYPTVTKPGNPMPVTVTGVFNHPAMGATYDTTQRPSRNVLRYSLANRFAPPSTIVTHCMFHRIQTADDITAPGQLGYSGNGKNALDIVLRLDGSAKAVNVSQWKDQNLWQIQTP